VIRILRNIRYSGIRHESIRLVWCRLWLRWRYGYEVGHYTAWGAYRWTRRAARRELAEMLEVLGL